MTVNWDEPLLWRKVYPARLVCSDAIGPDGCTHLVLVTENGVELAYWCRHDGISRFGGQRITNAPKKISGWQNIYRDVRTIWTYGTALFSSKAEADAKASSGRVACIYVEFTEGEGLDK